jgi:gamma-glutamylcyclotransferase (GGCT)/AIG2-like uncharacterized protein YtfP
MRAPDGRFKSRFGTHPCYLFAYGTLLTGTPDGTINQLLSDFLRPKYRAYIHGRLHNLGTYPGAVPSQARREKIFGQVFTIKRPGQVFSALDVYEGYSRRYPHQSEFVRRAVTAMQLPCQKPLTAWVYYYNRHPGEAPRLLSGDYLAASKPSPKSSIRGTQPLRAVLKTRDDRVQLIARP